jgi:glutaredoxin
VLRRGLLVLALLMLALVGCKNSEAQEDETRARTLPPLHFSDGTSSLMLTWIGARGDTHVETLPNLVPEEARGFVRVIVADSKDGTTDPIYVADLGAQEADGGYVARSLSRAEWEAEIARRREKAGPAAEPDETEHAPRRAPRRADADAEPSPPPPRSGPSADPGPGESPKGGIQVTIYGASWCGPCHQALDHLKHRGIRAVFKDIEEDPAAQREMQAKLQKSGARRGAIPVIDVGGKIIVGYSEAALDGALRDLAGGTAL